MNSTTISPQEQPHVVGLSDGGFVVTWTDWSGADGDSGGVFAQRYSSDGSPVGGEEQINSYASSFQMQPNVAELVDGSLVFTWGSYRQDGDGIGVYSKVVYYNAGPSGDVTISGTASEGETLIASNTLADEDGLGTITYQWQRDGDDIEGATANTYTLTQDDVGAEITVTASYTDNGGVAESVTSSSTSAVANVNDDPTGQRCHLWHGSRG